MVNFLRAELVKPLYTAAHILDRWRLLYIPEACVSKMKTAALCVFYTVPFFMLVGGQHGYSSLSKCGLHGKKRT